jgi:hypothetical protein
MQYLSIVNGVLTVNICHLTQFGVFGQGNGGAAVEDSSSSNSNTKLIIIVVCAGGGGLILLTAAIIFMVRRAKRHGGFGKNVIFTYTNTSLDIELH